MVAVDIRQQLATDSRQYTIIESDPNEPFALIDQAEEKIVARVQTRDEHIEIERDKNADVDIIHKHRCPFMAVEHDKKVAYELRAGQRADEKRIAEYDPCDPI